MFHWNISNSKSVIVFKPCHHSVWWILKFPSNTFVLKLTIWYLRTWNSITGIAIASTYLSPPPTRIFRPSYGPDLKRCRKSCASAFKVTYAKHCSLTKSRTPCTAYICSSWLSLFTTYYLCTCIYITAPCQNFMTFKEKYCRLATETFDWRNILTGNIGLAIEKPLIIAIAAMYVLVFPQICVHTYFCGSNVFNIIMLHT